MWIFPISAVAISQPEIETHRVVAQIKDAAGEVGVLSFQGDDVLPHVGVKVGPVLPQPERLGLLLHFLLRQNQGLRRSLIFQTSAHHQVLLHQY